jgi:hypothetical protein
VEDGEDLEQEVWVGALKAVPHRLQDGEHNMEAATKGGAKQRCPLFCSLPPYLCELILSLFNYRHIIKSIEGYMHKLLLALEKPHPPRLLSLILLSIGS